MVTLLADTAVRAKDLDAAAAQRAKEEAERKFTNRVGDLELAEAQIKLAEAVVQVQALGQLRKRHKALMRSFRVGKNSLPQASECSNPNAGRANTAGGLFVN